MLKFRSGALGVIEVNVLTYPRNLEGSITILGEKGSVKIGGTAVNRVEHWLFDDYDDDDKLVEAASTNPPNVYGFGHEGYYRNVLPVLHGDARPDTDGRAGRKSLELILGIYESAKTGREVPIPLRTSSSDFSRLPHASSPAHVRPLLDLKAQHATIRDDVVAAMMEVVDAQLFILGEPVAELEREVAALSHTKSRHRMRQRHRRDPARAAGARRRPRRRSDHDAVHVLRDGGHDSQRRRDAGVRRHRAATRSTSGPTRSRRRARRRRRRSIPVDLFGQMAPIETIAAADARACRSSRTPRSRSARGASIDGEWRMAGEVATIGTFSFFPSKNLGGYGDGGMIVTQDDALAERLKRLRVHGGAKQYFHDEVGYNCRLDALQAAVLSAKLPHLAAWSAKRRENAAYYDAAFADLAGDVRHARRRAGERVDLQPVHDPRAGGKRDALQAHPQGAGHRHRDLLSAAAAPPAVLRVPRLQRRAVPGERARGEGSAVAADLPELSEPARRSSPGGPSDADASPRERAR